MVVLAGSGKSSSSLTLDIESGSQKSAPSLFGLVPKLDFVEIYDVLILLGCNDHVPFKKVSARILEIVHEVRAMKLEPL